MRKGPRPQPIADRFWPKVEVRGADECWPWLATKRNGYGAIFDWRVGDKVGAHRVSYELAVGEIPVGHEIDHVCERRDCVNPAHLEAVTHEANVLRTAGRDALCRRGHALDGLKHDRNPDGTPRIRRYCKTCSRAAYHRRRGSVRT